MRSSKQFGLTEEQQIIHNIINDIRSHYGFLEIEEAVFDIANLNYILDRLGEIDFTAACRSYRSNLLKFVEEL